MIIYILILLFKIAENTLSTLRIIIIANGKKLLGAILQGIISLVWIFSTSMVVININKNPIKIISFTLGSLIGSYIGSYIEEKIALGTNMLTIVIDKKSTKEILKILKKQNEEIIILDGKNKNKLKDILIIMIKRKERKNIINQIKNIDKNSTIIIEKAYTFNNSLLNKPYQ